MTEKVGLDAFLNTNQFSRGLKVYTSGIERVIGVTAHAAQVVTFMGGVADKVFGFVGQVVSGAARAIVGLGRVSLESSIEFEAAFADVLKTTEGLEDAEGNLTELGQTVRQGLRDMAQEIPTSVNALAELAGVAGQLGIQEENLVNFTRTIADLGETTNIVGEQGAVQIAQFFNVMGTGQDLVDEFGSTIVALGNNFATTEQDVLNFAQRIAGAGAIADISEQNVLAISAAFTSVGIQAEAGGTAVQKVLFAMGEAARGTTGEMIDNTEAITKAGAKWERLQEQLTVATLKQSEYTDKTKESTRVANQIRIDNLTEQLLAQEAAVGQLTASHGKLGPASKQLEVFAKTAGVEVAEFAELFKVDAAGAFQLFVDGLGEAGDDAIGILDQLELSDSRLVRAFLSLSQASGVANEDISLLAETMASANVAWEENTALAEEAEKRYRTTKAQLEITKNVFKDMGITLGDALLPFVNEFLGVGQEIIREWGGKLPALIERHVIPVITKIGDVLRDVIGGFQAGGLGGGLEALFSGLGIGADTQAVIFQVIDKVQDFIAWLGENVPIAVGMASEFITGRLIPAFQSAGEWIQGTLIPAFQQVAAWIQDNVIPVIVTLADWFQQVLPIAIDELSTWWTAVLLPALVSLAEQWETNIQPALAELWAWLQERVPQAIAVAAEVWETVLKPALQAIGVFISETLIPIIGQIVGWLIENIPKAIDLAVLGFQTMRDGMLKVWTWITETLIPTFLEISTWLQETIKTAIEKATGYWEETLQPALERVWLWIDENIVPLFEAIGELLEVVWKKAIELAAELWEKTLQPALEKLWEFITVSLQPVLDTLGEFWEKTLKPGLDKVVEVFKKDVIPIFEKLFKGINDDLLPKLIDLQTFLKDKLQKAFEGIGTAIGKVVDFVVDLTTKIANFELPEWMTPGSPTPWEIGLRGVSDALQQLSRVDVPQLEAQLAGLVVAPSMATASSSPAMLPVAGPTTIDRSIQVSTPINDAQINNGMDLGLLQSIIVQTIGDTLGGIV